MNILILKGKEAKKFLKQDTKPLNTIQKEYLKKCKNIYIKNPIKEE